MPNLQRSLLMIALAILTLHPIACGNDDDDSGSNDDDAAPCSGLEGQSGDFVIEFESGGLDRSVRLTVPEGYDPSQRTPLVLNFHGGSSFGILHESLTGMPAKAREEGFITAAPEGIDASWNFGLCCPPAYEQNVPDVEFSVEAIQRIEEKWCIDPDRVFATGHSQGGMMAMRLACERADLIAAIAPVSSVMPVDPCNATEPVPAIFFHGAQDGFIPYDGSRERYPSVPDTFADWAQLNQCDSEPVQTLQNGDTTCNAYQACAEGAETELCLSEEASHSWPGSSVNAPGEVTTQDINATDAMWEFFERHPKR